MSDLTYGRDRLGDPRAAGRLEWLVTNGIGGFASGTVAGTLTRRHHGLLFAALKPPLGRTLLLTKLAEAIELDGAWVDLDTNEWASGATSPAGYLRLESFRLDDSVPTWAWAIGDTRLEKRVWMEQGENTTYVQYRLVSGRVPVHLHLRALVNHRDAQAVTEHGAWNARVEPATGGLRIEAHDGATPLWLLAPGADVRPQHEWHRGFALAHEHERGAAALEDHLYAGDVRAKLAPGDYLTVIASTRRDAGRGEAAPLALASALARRRAHDRSVLETWKRAQPSVARTAPAWVRQLVIAADAFLVERSTTSEPNGRTVIAGYPSFEARRRDLLMALPGLTLPTGRAAVARSILAAFARQIDLDRLPGFPDAGNDAVAPTADAALWYVEAVRAYHEATLDDAFLGEVFPALEEICAGYTQGTGFGIGVDPEDGLLRASEPGVPLTWMDARTGAEARTPRSGKPVELNALWFNALTTVASFARRLERAGDAYARQAARVEAGFHRFWNPTLGCLFDVLDGPHGNDASVRPNQILAVSLPESPLAPAHRRSVLDACGRLLLTSHGLRGLAADDPGYHAAAPHGGASWVWLLPHWALAHEHVHGDRQAALAHLEPLGNLIGALGVGWLPEIADGDLPHAPRGAIAFAHSVAEALRAYHLLAGERRRLRRKGLPRATAETARA